MYKANDSTKENLRNTYNRMNFLKSISKTHVL